MYLNVFLVLLLVCGLAGCAMTRKEQAGNQLQTRINELQVTLDERDTAITDLKDDVANLTEQIKNKENYAAAASGETTAHYKPEGTIRVNASSERVQLALQNAGYYNGPIDGKIGNKTKQAIADFQKANNLTPDGIIGKRTWATLKTYLD